MWLRSNRFSLRREGTAAIKIGAAKMPAVPVDLTQTRCESLGGALEYAGSAHASSDAHSHQSVAGIAALQFAENCGGELCASAAERMTERDRATIHVHAR